MSKLNRTAFIVEGLREANMLRRMIRSLDDKSLLDVMLVLPTEMNLYMLWNEIKDEPNIDIIEYLRERSESINETLDSLNSDDFSEVYLFFDLDAQQDNIKYNGIDQLIEIIKSMLCTFDNETDKGKLYISYPMCEAYSDYIPDTCKTFTSNCYQNPFSKDYKNRVGNNNPNAILTHLTIKKISEMIGCYLDRITCLHNTTEAFDYAKAKSISVLDIFYKQSELLKKELVIVLSAFPEFIIDYYKLSVLKTTFPAENKYYDEGCHNKIVL